MFRDRVSAITSGNRGKLLLLLAIAALTLTSYAATVSVTTSTYQTQYGLSYNITSGFTATDKGFGTVGSTLSASAQPCTWAAGGGCRTALTVAHYRYQLQLTLNIVPSVSTTYTVTVLWDQGSGQSTLGTLTVTVPSTATSGQVMTFNLDTGSTSFTTPLAVDVTVA